MNGMTVIYDTDPAYGAKLADALIRHGFARDRTVCFDTAEGLALFASENRVDTMILSKDAEAQTEGIFAGKRIYLTEIRGYASIRGVATVYKYQPAEKICEGIVKAMASRSSGEDVLPDLSGRGLITVFSPVGRSFKTSFAFTLGQLLAVDAKVLYLNLEPVGGFDGFLPGHEAGSLSDVMYLFETGADALKTADDLARFLGHFHGMDYLLPVRVPTDISRAEAKIMTGLVSELARVGDYDIVILEPGQDFRFLDVFLPLSRKIYLLTRTDPVSKAKIDETRRYFGTFPEETVLARTEEVLLPAPPPFCGGKDYAENLLFGEIGDRARGLLGGMC